MADAVYAIAQQGSPETDTAIDVCNGLRDTLEQLAELFKALGMHCAEFAGFLDHAHAQVEHELTTLLAWTAAVESGGALLSVVSFGVAEAPTQVAEAARIAATAARVGAILARLAGLAHDGAAAIGRLAPRFAELSRSLRPLLSARAVTAETRSVVLSTAEELRSVSAAERLATVPKSPGFGSARSLTQHFAEHGNDFGCASAAEYDAAAREFLERARRLGLPTKVDSDGIVRVFEPGTNTFAAYNADGTVRTFFKRAVPRTGPDSQAGDQ